MSASPRIKILQNIVVVPAKEADVQENVLIEDICKDLNCPDFDYSLLEEIFGDIECLNRQLIDAEKQLSRFFKILSIKRENNFCDLQWCHCQVEHLIERRAKLLADIQQLSVGNLRRHLKKSCRAQEPSPKKLKVTHDTQRFCDVCSEHVSSRDYVGHLRSVKHKNNSLAFSTEGVQVITSAFKSRIVSYRISANTQYINLKEFVESLADVIKKLVREQIDIMGSVKVNCELFGYFILESKDRGEVKSFNTRNQVLTISSDLSEWFKDIIEKLEVDATEFEHRESGINIQLFMPCLHNYLF
ncbi:hypothetical protein PPYR_00476 [Photinus pyralis]|uniref:Uncharacterized protein n=1 Tax=Photinus pyralis TaxID=7054 RepID=A0A5N4B1R8_PHOPY|nr:hypothetical protein PPYR_00476 [Photinus pyralis]